MHQSSNNINNSDKIESRGIDTNQAIELWNLKDKDRHTYIMADKINDEIVNEGMDIIKNNFPEVFEKIDKQTLKNIILLNVQKTLHMKSKIISLIIIISIFVLSVNRIIEKTENIILHWDFVGNITSYGSKHLILFLPIISCFIFFILRRKEKSPLKTNMLTKVKNTDNNKLLIVQYLRIINPIILLILLYITACSAQYLVFQSGIIIVALAFIIGLYIYTKAKLDK